MTLDLRNLRTLCTFLSKTEIDFDLVSAVDELATQIRLEFDFKREARIMDAVAMQFEVGAGEGGRAEPASAELSCLGRPFHNGGRGPGRHLLGQTDRIPCPPSGLPPARTSRGPTL